ncbi:histidine phosphatase family protein [Paenibacillus mesophilus]|uniref:histidine phosphatase family protein n=1 Tax=Paenibacillus mesophilus TaxID=2582849 RepID=UPI001EE46A76|nr:histidine phosphatase family protein [Paenibacillus mesophilus]
MKQEAPASSGGGRHSRDALQNIKFDHVFSSLQERAIQTAEIATGIKAIVDARLDVFDLGEADGLPKSKVKMAGAVPDPSVYKGVEEIRSYIKRVFDFMREMEARYAVKELNILLSGHKCTTGCIGAYFEGIPVNGNISKYSSGNGEYKAYPFKSIDG